MNHISNVLSGLKVGDPINFQNMALFPLLGGESGVAGYLTLDEALANEAAEVTETSEEGSVPELRFLNKGDKPVFLLDGEELIGAKQDRVLNLSILAPAGKDIIIPVSCVESGRWRHKSAKFKSSPRTHFSKGRARNAENVSISLNECGNRRSDQGEVWDHISAKSESLGSVSPTDAMGDVFKKHKASLGQFVEHFVAADGQIGALFAINGEIAGIDIFDNAETFAKLSSKLVRSYALDAIDEISPGSNQASKEAAEMFLKEIEVADTVGFPAVGLGEDVRLTGNGVTGGALIVEGKSIHLCAFPRIQEPDEGRGGQTAITRASNRRRMH
jgi:hypothetical protein